MTVGSVDRTAQLPSVAVTTDANNPSFQKSFLYNYFCKWRGSTEVPLPREKLRTCLISWSGAFIAILVVAALDQYAGAHENVTSYLLGILVRAVKSVSSFSLRINAFIPLAASRHLSHAPSGPSMEFQWLIAPLGASSVLMFGVPGAKLSQPRNVVGTEPLPLHCHLLPGHVLPSPEPLKNYNLKM